MTECCESCLVTCERDAVLADGITVPPAECTFCGNPSIPDLDYVYEKTGLHRYCLSCYEEYNPYSMTPTRGLTSTFTDMLD